MYTKTALLLTVDVEDWFQVENFKQTIPFSSWPSLELRVEKNTHKLLDLLDSPGSKTVRTTFFVLGWVAERLPHLVCEIRNRGHEVASHGYNHVLCSLQKRDELRQDLESSKKLLEDITGSPVAGYRAPSFSIDAQSLEVIDECGYLYDSSYNSFGMNERYGKLDLSAHPRKGAAFEISNNFYELPVSNVKVGGSTFHWGGGGYFRLVPFPLFKLGIRSIMDRESVYMFYMHPWEVDPEQPRVKEASPLSSFRHYINLGRTGSKLAAMLRSFSDCRFVSCSDYIEEVRGGS